MATPKALRLAIAPLRCGVGTGRYYHKRGNPRERTPMLSELENFSRVGWQRDHDLISCIDVRTVSRRVGPLAAAVVTVVVLLQGGTSQAQTVASTPTLKELVAQATQLSNEVDSLG